MVHKTTRVAGQNAKQTPSSRPTIKDVAAKCGVHASTVSRALSPAMSHLVATDVAKRIRAAAAAGLAGIAVEPGRVMIVDRAAVVELADREGLFIIGHEQEAGRKKP